MATLHTITRRRFAVVVFALSAALCMGCVEADESQAQLATTQHNLAGQSDAPGLAQAAAAPGAQIACAQTGTCRTVETIEWEVFLASDANHPLTDVWGPTADDVRAVGWQSPTLPNRGRVLHFDGSGWTQEKTGPMATLNAISGNTVDTYVAGTDGMIARRVGNDWVTMSTPTDAKLNDLYVGNGNDVMAVGDGGTILALQGQQWKSLHSPTTENLNGIWGSNGTSIIVGDAGTLAIVGHGSVVRAIPTGLSQNLNGIWGSNGTSIVVGDEGLFAFFEDGNLRAIPLGVPADLNSIWGSNGTSIVVVGKLGSIISIVVESGGFSWEPGPKLTDEDLISVWGDGNGTMYAVGANGTVLRGQVKLRP